MISEVAARESARAAAVAREEWRGPGLTRPAGDDALPIVSRLSEAVVRTPEAVEVWRAATEEALRSRATIVDGVLAIDALRVPLELARYHARLEGWHVALARPSAGLRGAWYRDAARVHEALEALGFPVAIIDVLLLHKAPRSGDASPFRPSNVLRRVVRHASARDDLAGVREIVAALNGEADSPIPIADSYTCDGACALCGTAPTDDRPDRYAVETLHKGRRTAAEMRSAGVTDLRYAHDAGVRLSRQQRIQIESVTRDERHVDAPALHAFLDRLVWPRFYLDFEAYATTVAPFAGLQPNEHTPVVASVHVQMEPDGEVAHEEFIAHPAGDDRRSAFWRWLCDLLGEHGSIVVFSRPFESSMVRQLARLADDGDRGDAIAARMVDLLEPFDRFMVYDPAQLGRVSLKSVLPAYTDDSYEPFTVRDGMHANLGWTRLADRARAPVDAGARAASAVTALLAREGNPAPDVTATEIARYCAADTAAMVALVAELAAAAHRQTNSDAI